MVTDMNESKIQIFEDRKIRSVWDYEKEDLRDDMSTTELNKVVTDLIEGIAEDIEE